MFIPKQSTKCEWYVLIATVCCQWLTDSCSVSTIKQYMFYCEMRMAFVALRSVSVLEYKRESQVCVADSQSCQRLFFNTVFSRGG